jgi:hypothetical protein
MRVEVGLDGDVDAIQPELADDGTDAAQLLIWRHSRRPIPLRAERQDGVWTLVVDRGMDEGLAIGRLASGFERSIRALAHDIGGPKAWPSGRIKGFGMVTARTVTGSGPEGGPRFWVSPVVAGLPVVWLNAAD